MLINKRLKGYYSYDLLLIIDPAAATSAGPVPPPLMYSVATPCHFIMPGLL